MTERRIEGAGVDPQLNEGLAAPVADPLWLLARQWQVGEFRGEDAAQPMIVEAVVDSFAVTGLVLSDKGRDVHAWEGTPIEVVIERTAPPADTHAALEAGLALLRQLRRVGASDEARQTFRKTYPVGRKRRRTEGSLQERQLDLAATGGMDGLKLWSDLADMAFDVTRLDILRAIAQQDQASVLQALAAWLAEEEARVSRPGRGVRTWNERTLDHSARVVADTSKGPIVLSAPAYGGGRLEWYDFDLERQPAKLPKQDRREVRTLVSPLRFAGQPAARWWEIEEGDTYFGDLPGGADDLARSVLASFAAVGGDDWFVIPMTLPTGTLAQVKALRVHDNFTDRPVEIASTSETDADEVKARKLKDRVWRWTELSPRSGKDVVNGPPLLLLLPATNTIEQGQPLERVAFRRDEMANLAWAIERVVPGPMGQGLRNSTSWPEPPPATAPGVWRFELGTRIPQHWYPMVPVRLTGDAPAITLRRGLLAQEPGTDPQAPPAGELLGPGRPYYLDEASLPSGGVEVARRWQMARSADGRAHLWLGREKRASSGPMERTPLEFDRLTGFRTENRKR